MKIKHITQKHKDFPVKLLEIPSPPKQLYYLGAPLTDYSPSIAVVGTRNPTTYGKQIVSQLVTELAAAGVSIISGLALGVDGLAHRACLDVKGHTIAVLACGLDQIYPASHRQLALDILESGGSIVSEYAVETPAFKQNFVARNRLVSGLADALLITEATAKSGTLHTVNFALAQGKTVMVVPGNITSPMSAGTNQLIKTGATPVTSVADIIETLGMHGHKAHKTYRGDNKAEQTVLDLLKSGITDGEELQTQSQLSAGEFQQTLTMLEIKGQIQPLGANHWGLS